MMSLMILLSLFYYFSGARKTIVADVFVDLLMASSYDKTCDDELQENRREAEHHQRKGSFLPKCFAAMLNEKEDAAGPNTTRKIEKGDNEPQSGETKYHLEHNEREDNSNYRRQEEQQDEVKKDTEKGYNKITKLGSGKEDQIDDNVEISISITDRQQVILPVTNDGKLGVDYLGFKYERSEDLEKDHLGCTSGITKPRKSLAFSLPEAPGKTKIDEVRARKELRLEKAITAGEEGRQIQVEKQRTTSDVHDLVTSSPIIPRPRAKKRPKTVKDWLLDPNVYKVYYHLSCNYC